MLQWPFEIYLLGNINTCPAGYMPRSRIVGIERMCVQLFYILLCDFFFQTDFITWLPSAINENSYCFTSLPTLRIIKLLKFLAFLMCVTAVLHCVLNLNFSDN